MPLLFPFPFSFSFFSLSRLLVVGWAGLGVARRGVAWRGEASFRWISSALFWLDNLLLIFFIPLFRNIYSLLLPLLLFLFLFLSEQKPPSPPPLHTPLQNPTPSPFSIVVRIHTSTFRHMVFCVLLPLLLSGGGIAGLCWLFVRSFIRSSVYLFIGSCICQSIYRFLFSRG